MAYGLTDSVSFVAASNQYASVANTAVLQIVTNLSLECWVKFSSTGITQTFMAKYGSGTDRNYLFDLDGTDLRLITGGSSFSVGSVTWSPSTGIWYHVAATYDFVASEKKFYVNGVQQGTTQTSQTNPPLAGTSNFFVAVRNAVDGANFDGKMSLARLWSKALSSTEINNNMCSVLGATTSLVGEWTFDNTYADDSGNSLTLTANGSPTFGADLPATCAVTPVNSNFIMFM